MTNEEIQAEINRIWPELDKMQKTILLFLYTIDPYVIDIGVLAAIMITKYAWIEEKQVDDTKEIIFSGEA